MVERRSCHCFS